MKTMVYVDGFNLYYGALKRTPYRWLDLGLLCQKLLPRHDVVGIRYFSALVEPRPGNPEQRVRQELYLRALRTIPGLSIHLGFFLTHEVSLPLAPPGKGYARVIKTEEKGSDVNLATHLLADGFTGQYDLAVILSNDSDLLPPMEYVKDQLCLPVGLLNPQRHASLTLSSRALFVKNIRKGLLAQCQFPSRLRDEMGEFGMPKGW